MPGNNIIIHEGSFEYLWAVLLINLNTSKNARKTSKIEATEKVKEAIA